MDLRAVCLVRAMVNWGVDVFWIANCKLYFGRRGREGGFCVGVHCAPLYQFPRKLISTKFPLAKMRDVLDELTTIHTII